MHLAKVQFLPEHQGKARRYVDGVMYYEPNQHLSVALGNLLGRRLLDIKPLTRKGESYDHVFRGGGNQILSHNFQDLYNAYFRFFGRLGQNVSSEGMVLSIASSQCLSASLQNAGAAEVDVKAQIGAAAPLFSRKTTLALFHGDQTTLKKTGLVFMDTTEEDFF